MKSPLHHRQSIPFFYDKSALEFKQDRYERYDPMVIRQTVLHLVDDIWGGYPLQELLDWASSFMTLQSGDQLVELGCSTGRWIGSIAQQYPQVNCWGLDFSYQLLKRAHEYWIAGDTIHLDFSKKGFSQPLEINGHRLTNLRFGLAKAAQLPFADNSQQVVLHSFLLDRVADPRAALAEMYRVLVPGGRLVFITPLNFQNKQLWEQYHPPIKIYQVLTDLGFSVIEWKEDFIIREPLDLRGNAIHWNGIGVVAEKTSAGKEI